MELAGSSKTLVTFYKTMRYHIPEDSWSTIEILFNVLIFSYVRILLLLVRCPAAVLNIVVIECQWLKQAWLYVGVLINLWLFLFAAQPKEFFLAGLKKLEQRSHKCVELSEEYVE
jgi:hypothetical protein